MRSLTAILSAAVLLVAVGASADDAFPAPWRGAEGTVWAKWDSWLWGASANPGPDEGDWAGAGVAGDDPVGYVRDYSAGTATFHPMHAGRLHVIELAEGGRLGFWLPNFFNLENTKTVRVQVTYKQVGTPPDPLHGPSGMSVWRSFGRPPEGFPIRPAEDTYTWDLPDFNTVPDENGWQTMAFDQDIVVNPFDEFIELAFDGYPAFVDQVVIDTWCHEEGASPVESATWGRIKALYR